LYAPSAIIPGIHFHWTGLGINFGSLRPGNPWESQKIKSLWRFKIGELPLPGNRGKFLTREKTHKRKPWRNKIKKWTGGETPIKRANCGIRIFGGGGKTHRGGPLRCQKKKKCGPPTFGKQTGA